MDDSQTLNSTTIDDSTINDQNHHGFPSTPENGNGTNAAISSPSPHTTDKVQRVAQNIYAELETNLKNFGEASIKNLIPLLAGLIEDYQTALTFKEKLACEIELHKEDNEQLLNHFEREKYLRKKSEERSLENEDFYIKEKQEFFEKIEKLED